MPRPMLFKPQQNSRQDTVLSTRPSRTQAKQQDQQAARMMRDRLLRKKRSKAYMDAIARLDAGGHVHNQDKVNEIINTIRNEFPEVELDGNLAGIVSICYLGEPYEVHTLDFADCIIEHYKSGEALPNGMEKARGIAMHGGYEYIEVYSDRCCAVGEDGTVSVIKD